MKFLGTVIGAASGSLNGITASHNKGGQYFRKRSIPTNPNSSRQQTMRAAFGSAVNAWANLLTETTRLEWKTYAQNVTFTDKLGQPLQLSGQQAFIRSYSLRAWLGLTLTTSAPTIYNTGSPITSIKPIITAPANSIGVASPNVSTTLQFAVPPDDDGDIIIQLSTPLGETTKFFKGPYQYSATVAATATTATATWDGLTLGLSQETLLSSGQIRAMRARVLYDDNRLSEPWEMICPVIEDV